MPLTYGWAEDLQSKSARTVSDGFLSDPTLPVFGKVAEVFSTRPSRQNPYFRLPLEQRGAGVVSWVDISASGDRVIDYIAGLPEGPLSEDITAQDECQIIATEFARRQLPALFDPGAEVKCEPQPKIVANGAYLFNFHRVQQGVAIPPRALVGVRVYDGKVVRWTPEYEPPSVSLEPKLTLDQAVATLQPYLTNFGWLPGTVLESVLEVVSFKGKQRLAWGIKMEMHSARSKKADALEGMCFCHVDANDGTLLNRTFPSLNADLYRWYVSKGGRNVPAIETRLPESLFTDSFPVPSSDGKRMLFHSTRPRVGWPEWLPDRPPGLFLAKAAGTEMTCLVPTAVGYPKWGPKPNQIAYLQDGLVILDMNSGDRITFSTDHDHEFGAFTWLHDGTIIAIRSFQTLNSQLVRLDPKKPNAPSVELTKPTTAGDVHQALVLDREGRVLYTVKSSFNPNPDADQRRNKDPYRLCLLDVRQREPQEEVVVPYLQGGVRMVLSPDGKAYLNCQAAGTYQVVDLASKSISNWQPPRIACPDSTFRSTIFPTPNDFIFLGDGSMLFSADHYSGDPEDARAQVIHSCAADGAAPRLITRPEKAVAAAFIFDATRKTAF